MYLVLSTHGCRSITERRVCKRFISCDPCGNNIKLKNSQISMLVNESFKTNTSNLMFKMSPLNCF